LTINSLSALISLERWETIIEQSLPFSLDRLHCCSYFFAFRWFQVSLENPICF